MPNSTPNIMSNSTIPKSISNMFNMFNSISKSILKSNRQKNKDSKSSSKSSTSSKDSSKSFSRLSFKDFIKRRGHMNVSTSNFRYISDKDTDYNNHTKQIEN
ncbi:3580_t:CDS:1 [Dentiscutata erythropus]|uniref:3580_t:CDS:1 n=1 Tax=Dentiscutata erythropus TaxID=1348616 RepID=A0A9N9ANT9_9GLOM|nr:3580_t:CDS:1 [Dentiscutata erythropus]